MSVTDPTVWAALAWLGATCAFPVALWWARRARPRLDAVWGAVAARRGAAFRPFGSWPEARRGRVEAVVEQAVVALELCGTQPISHTRARARFAAGAGPRFRVLARRGRAAPDASFDERFVVTSDDEAAAERAWTHRARRLMCALARARVESDGAEVTITVPGHCTDEPTLDAMLDLAGELASYGVREVARLARELEAAWVGPSSSWDAPKPARAELATIGACEGTSFRCDPSLSFSTVRHPPSESDAGAPVLHQCVGECWIWRIALGARHTCVVAGDALEVACFGANEAGQSSPSSDADEVPPTWVGQRSTFTEGSSTIAAGALATCVVVQRSIVCWGSGAVLGGADHDPPRVVPLPEGAEAMSVESGEVVLRAGTEADGWYVFGAYEVGRPLADAPLGEPRAWRSEERPLYAIGGFFYWTAGPVSLSRSVVGAIPPPGRLDRALLATERTLGPTWADPFWRMQAGSLHACAWIEGELDCAGQNERGQFGRGPTSWSGFQRLSPPDGVAWIAAACVGGHLDVRADGDEIVVGERRGGHTCVRDTEGGVWCIGANDRGQLGDGTLTDRDVPVRVVGLPGRVRDIACGGEHTCALVGSDVYCWGDNSYGQLGVPSSELTLRATPERVALE